MLIHRLGVSLAVCVVGLSCQALLPSSAKASESVDFAGQIAPLLQSRCIECHRGEQAEGGLDLTTAAGLARGTEHGPVIAPGSAETSRLWQVVSGADPDLKMPPEGAPLDDGQLAKLRAWIEQGASWPAEVQLSDPRRERAAGHWAFQPLAEIGLPDVQASSWPRTAVDSFVLAKLEAAGIAPSPPASARQLIRRLSYDLTGLPPSPEAVEQFCADYELAPEQTLLNFVDDLLASPRYGERWARHWLDVARYADSDGQESDRDRPTAYPYRDFVIQAFNDDLPFDQFVRWQLAGDEYEPQNRLAVAATGFLAAGPFAALPDKLMEDERLRNRYNELDDMLSTVGTGLLGLTLGCARCHDHKYDAIPAADYYSMLSAFHSGDRRVIPLAGTQENVWAYQDDSATVKPTWLFRRANYYDHDVPVELGFISVLSTRRAPSDYWREAREKSPLRESTQQRRAMAEWMVDVEEGAGALVARVFVNRLWQHHFGRGIVATVGDFGVRSEPPTHPELLDWLARDFVEHGWRIKRLQRMMVTSAVYLQASSTGMSHRDTGHTASREREPDAPSAESVVGPGVRGSQVDPDNRLLWHMPLRRLEAEALRDALLAVSGTLNLAAYGPAVKPPIAAEAILARNLKDEYPDNLIDGPEVRRRTIYLFHKRVVPYPLLQAFDKPDAQQSCSRRDRTTVAPQALAILNDPLVRSVAYDFADRLLRESHSADKVAEADVRRTWVERSFALALSRPASRDELRVADVFLQQQLQRRQASLASESQPAAANIDLVAQRQALADFCQVLFGLNEFIYVD